jgi:hypothetical protein
VTLWSDPRASVIIDQSPPPAFQPGVPTIPSVMDLPVSMGIRSAPVGAAAIYVLDGSERSLRQGGAKVLSMEEAKPETDSQDGGPRIIHLKVPRGR